jgi:hypothetical protein
MDENIMEFTDSDDKNRYVKVFVAIQAIIQYYGLDDCTEVDPLLLNQAFFDYDTDTNRLKSFHVIENSNVEKIYSYFTFWLLRNHVIRITNPTTLREKFGNEFDSVNERIFAYFLIRQIATELAERIDDKIQIDKFEEKFTYSQNIVDLIYFLYYTFRYRQYSQQSLLLFTEGVMKTAEFMVLNT